LLPLGEGMIGPPGIPKLGRRIFSFAGAAPARRRDLLLPLKWMAALYLAGVLAHFSDHMAYQLSSGRPLDQVLTSAPVCLVWPADLIGTLINLS
jgi:hypothetical protein